MMKSALKAGLSVLILSAVIAPAFAQTAVIQTQQAVVQTAPAGTVITAPALIAAPATVEVGAPMCTRELTFPATYPGGIIHVAPTIMPGYAFDYGHPKMDYSEDYIWEPFGP